MTMTPTILQRIYHLADASLAGATTNPLYAKAASVLRRLASDGTAVEKAQGIAATVMKLAPADQERVLAAVEGLAP